MRCGFRDMDDVRCRHRATHEITVHESQELDGRWFWVPVCDRHFSKYDDDRKSLQPKRMGTCPKCDATTRKVRR